MEKKKKVVLKDFSKRETLLCANCQMLVLKDKDNSFCCCLDLIFFTKLFECLQVACSILVMYV